MDRDRSKQWQDQLRETDWLPETEQPPPHPLTTVRAFHEYGTTRYSSIPFARR